MLYHIYDVTGAELVKRYGDTDVITSIPNVTCKSLQSMCLITMCICELHNICYGVQYNMHVVA